MDMTTIARPYATAAFATAKAAEQIEPWRCALKIDREIITNPELAQWLRNPELTAEQTIELFQLVHAGFSELQLDKIADQHTNFLRLIISNNRLFALPDIYQQYKRLVAKNANIVNVRVDSALELSDAEKQRLESSLVEKFNSQVKTHYMLKPEMIAGVSVDTTRWVLDGSAETLLARLKDRLIIER